MSKEEINQNKLVTKVDHYIMAAMSIAPLVLSILWLS